MPKKQSYMNKNSILSEGFFSDLFKIFKQYPKLKNNTKLKSDIKDLNKGVKSIEDRLNDELKSYGSKKQIKIEPYKLTDFIKGI